MMPDSVCMQATPSITAVLIVAMPVRSADPEDATAMRHHHGAGSAEEADRDDGADRQPDRRVDASARVASMEVITRLPPTAIHLRVSRRPVPGAR